MKRLRAQRPLPSITIAMWRGTPSGRAPLAAGSVIRSPPEACACTVRAVRGSDGHDLRFLARHQPVDLGDGAVGELLHLVLQTTLVVLGQGLVLGKFSGLFVGVATDVAHDDAGFLASVAGDLGEVAAALLGQ